VELLRNGVVVLNVPLGSNSFNHPFAAGSWNYVLRVTNSTTGGLLLSDPIAITPICVRSFTASPTECGGVFLFWEIDGTASGSLTLFRGITDRLGSSAE
jgi:hypothetical protein